MNLEYILSNFNPETREEWAQVESTAELQSKAQKLGIELTAENAQALFTALTSKGELLSDDAVAGVTGGNPPLSPKSPWNKPLQPHKPL